MKSKEINNCKMLLFSFAAEESTWCMLVQNTLMIQEGELT